MKKLFFIIIFVGITCLKTYSLSDSLEIGDKFIAGTNFWSRLDYIYIDLDVSLFSDDVIWTVKNITPTQSFNVLFANNRNDSFWYDRSKIEEDLFNYRLIYVSEYKKFAKKYSPKVMAKLLRRETWIGMDWQQAIIALGYPEKINKTTTAHRVDEQWIYGKYTTSYYYFTNGKLTAIQD